MWNAQMPNNSNRIGRENWLSMTTTMIIKKNYLTGYQKMWNGHLGQMKAVKHRTQITLQGFRPMHAALYRAGPTALDFEWDEFNKMLWMNVLEPAQTEWTSLIVFKPERDGVLYFCVNYWKLNAFTVRDSYPLLMMDESIDSLRVARGISTLVGSSEYWKVEVDEEVRDKTAFNLHHGLYRFIWMLSWA